MSYIAFNDKVPFQMLYAREDTMFITSVADIDQSADRQVLTVHFDNTVVSVDALCKYFSNATEETSIITIIDDAGSAFIHTDYCIPVKLGNEMVGNDPNMHTVLSLAKLSPKDKLLRQMAGRTKVYTGTPLEIAIEKKIDEMSDRCTQIIYNGLDIPLSSGETKHFTFDEQDQANVTGLAVEMVMGSDLIMWHDDIEEDDCELYSNEDMGTIINFLSLHKKYNISYFRNLRRYLRSLSGPDDIDTRLSTVGAVWYGFELPEEFKSNSYKKIVEKMGDFIGVELMAMDTPPDYTAINQTIVEQKYNYAIEHGLVPNPELVQPNEETEVDA